MTGSCSPEGETSSSKWGVSSERAPRGPLLIPSSGSCETKGPRRPQGKQRPDLAAEGADHLPLSALAVRKCTAFRLRGATGFPSWQTWVSVLTQTFLVILDVRLHETRVFRLPLTAFVAPTTNSCPRQYGFATAHVLVYWQPGS